MGKLKVRVKPDFQQQVMQCNVTYRNATQRSAPQGSATQTQRMHCRTEFFTLIQHSGAKCIEGLVLGVGLISFEGYVTVVIFLQYTPTCMQQIHTINSNFC